MNTETIVLLVVGFVLFAGMVIFAVTRSKIKDEEKQQKLLIEAEKQKEILKKEAVIKEKNNKVKNVIEETSSQANLYIEQIKTKKEISEIKKRNESFEKQGPYNLIDDSILMEDDDAEHQDIAKDHLGEKLLYGDDLGDQANSVHDILNELDVNDYSSSYQTKSLSKNLFGDKMQEKENNEIANEYKHLSKKMKVLIVTNALNKKSE